MSSQTSAQAHRSALDFTYKETLQVWCVVRVFPSKYQVLRRFHSRSDAEGFRTYLARTISSGYEVVYDPYLHKEDQFLPKLRRRASISIGKVRPRTFPGISLG